MVARGAAPAAAHRRRGRGSRRRCCSRAGQPRGPEARAAGGRRPGRRHGLRRRLPLAAATPAPAATPPVGSAAPRGQRPIWAAVPALGCIDGARAARTAPPRAATACWTSFWTSGDPPRTASSSRTRHPAPVAAAGSAPRATRPLTWVRNCRIVNGRRFGLLSIACSTTRSISGVSVEAPSRRRLGGTTSPFSAWSRIAAVSAPETGRLTRQRQAPWCRPGCRCSIAGRRASPRPAPAPGTRARRRSSRTRRAARRRLE